MLSVSNHSSLNHFTECCLLQILKMNHNNYSKELFLKIQKFKFHPQNFTLPCEIRIPRNVSKPTETPCPVSPSRPSRSNIGIHGQKSSEMWCRSSNRFLRPMMAISCRWLYSIGTYRQTFNYLNTTFNTFKRLNC